VISESIKSALVVAAHPDDEVLGCGGTIASLAKAGIAVRIAFLADGVGARKNNSEAAATHDAVLQARVTSADHASALLGAEIVYRGDLPDNRLDTVPLLDVVKIVERLVDELLPDIVFTHHVGDLNVDHRQVHRAVVTACRPQLGHPVRGLLFFEVPSSTEWQPPGSGPAFVPNWFYDVSATLTAKRAALEAYAVEMRGWPHSRSYEAVEHLARWRGASIGVDAAEAFMLGRWVNRR
jgi:LmbE family N-acetylglucosaminyl deacetylase